MEFLSTTQTYLDKIPGLIGNLRELIIKLLTYFNLSTESNIIVFGILSIILAYLYLKQFVASGFLKLSTLLNLLFLSMLIYIAIVYIK